MTGKQKPPSLRVLLVADTHLGFDLPRRPRTQRRRRGPDFFANFERALQPAMTRQVDVVVHGGDLLYRSRVKAWLVERALLPLKRVASLGIPVLLVPGNHERSQIPYGLLAMHRNLFVFWGPKTLRLTIQGLAVAFAGFPHQRHDVRRLFADLVLQTGVYAQPADLRLLCMHQCVEGATVGPRDFVFRRGHDVVRTRDLPADFAAVLSGHIHRAQILRRELRGRRLPTPVVYPGSVERTSAAERFETKGYWLLDFTVAETPGGELSAARFCPLPTVHEALPTGPRTMYEGVGGGIRRARVGF